MSGGNGASGNQGQEQFSLEAVQKILKDTLWAKEQALSDNVSYDPHMCQTVADLAKLPQLDYEKLREDKARMLGLRTVALDKAVKQVRARVVAASCALVDDPEPWPDPVDGAMLLEEILVTFQRFVILPDHGAETLALWTVFTHAHDAVRISPIMGLTSPDKRCGKTTVLGLLGALVRRALPASNISPAAVFRITEKIEPTLLIDEADSFLKDNEELRGILNCGHTRELAFVARCDGEANEPRRFSTWAPKCVALIGKLPDTLTDRAIVLPMRRKRPDEVVERYGIGIAEDFIDLKRRCIRWAADNLGRLKDADPELVAGLHDRAQDNWRPLLAIADLVGGEWPGKARKAAVALSGSEEDEDAVGIMLLRDIRDTFDAEGCDKITSARLVEILVELEEQPWAGWNRGNPISARQVATKLRPFKIRPVQFWAGEKQRGYLRKNFESAWASYTPILSGMPVGSSNNAGLPSNSSGRNENGLPDGKAVKPSNQAGSTGIPDESEECRQRADETPDERHDRLNEELTQVMRENDARKAREKEIEKSLI